MEENHQLAVGQRLKILRKQLDLSQTQFADKLGVKQQNVWGWENGSAPPMTALKKMEDLFNANINFLVTGKGEMFLTEDTSTNNQNLLNWEGEAYEAVKSERDRLRQQVDKMQSWIDKMMNGKVSFHKPSIVPGLPHLQMIAGAKSEAKAA